MNILMILDGEFPTDDRVEKEALSLLSEGNKVYLLCLNWGKFAKSENYKGIEIVRININKSLRNKLQATYLILPFYRMIWKKAINDQITRYSVNIIHIHDLPLSDIAIKLRKKYPLKVVCDQHEFYSNWIVNTAHYNTFIGKIVKLFSNWAVYEKRNLLQADMVITVEEPLKEIYISKVGLDRKKVVALPNTPASSIFDTQMTDVSINEKYKNNYVLFYAGHLDILRGINTIIESLPLLKDSIPNLKFVFAGKFTKKYYDPLKYIETLGVSDLTDYLGWVPQARLPYYISASNICLHVPPAISTEVNSSIATKIYQYVLMNKPLIVGQAKLMKDFVETNRIGLVINDSDPQDLAEKILMLHSSPSLVDEFTANTKKIAPRYSWKTTSRPFIQYYQNLSQ
jgi:glycosyltransferase involved in cell wall biosynthesis